jgi:serine/threonine-protein kinase
MPTALICPQGHQWRPANNGISSLEDPQALCPVCGSRAMQQRTLAEPGTQSGSEITSLLPGVFRPADPTDLESTLDSAQLNHMGNTVSTAEFISTKPNSAEPNSASSTVLLGQDWPTVANYEIVGLLGRGGMGVVYKARHVQLDRLVALKMVLAGPHAGPEELARFRSEAEAVAKLQHANIVQVYEVGESDGRPYLSLEFVGGGSLAQKLEGTPLPSRQAATLIATLARAVHLAHQRGIIHRDLKPANVLLTEDGVPKITDFGLAKRLDRDTGQTRSGTIMGTPSHMAPEQASGRTREITPATDVYALGAILYELLTGRPPFRAETPMETVYQVLEREAVPPRLLNCKVDRDLELICLKCLEKDAGRRYPTALALAEDLQRYLCDEPVSVRSFNMLDRLARTLDRSNYDREFHSWGTLVLWFAVLILAEHVIVFVFNHWQPPHPRTWIHLTRITQFTLMGLVFWRTRSRQLLPTSAAERQLWSIWLGYLVGGFIIWLVHRELHPQSALQEELTLYPTRAVLAGLAFFAMGGSYWGGCYLVGVAFFVLAAIMPWRQLYWAPLEFGLVWSAILVSLGVRLRRLAERHDEYRVTNDEKMTKSQ